MVRANELSLIRLRYLDTGPAGVVYTVEHTIIVMDGELPTFVALAYSSTLIQAEKTKLGLEDVWGNVKVPRIESLVETLIDHNGWIPFTSSSSQVESCSSLLGIPISGVPITGQTNFGFESSCVSLVPIDRLECNIQFRQWTYIEYYGTCRLRKRLERLELAGRE